jgi:hypothetical protein
VRCGRGRVDVGGLASRHDRQAGVARRARFHGDQHVDLLLEHQGIEGFLGSCRPAAIVRDLECNLPAEDSALGVDFLYRKFGGLNDGRGDHAIGPAEAYWNTNLDRLLRARRHGKPASRNQQRA